MPGSTRGQRTRGARRSTLSRAGAGESDSGHGSSSLTDAFIAEEETCPRAGKDRWVVASHMIEQMEVRWSSCVAALVRPTPAAVPPMTLVKAPPGGQRTVGYLYQELPLIVEETMGLSDHVGEPTGLSGNADGFWDVGIPQVDPGPHNNVPAGRKCLVTSATPGTPRRGRNPMHRASALDFSPTHFVEPQSDTLIPQQHLASPMRTSPAHSAVHMSTPMSQNPLLQSHGSNSNVTHMPLPMGSQLHRYRTTDANTAWAVAEGLIPIPEGSAPPGFVPAIVGGMSYEVCTPGSGRQCL
jgi:hypothetical protein